MKRLAAIGVIVWAASSAGCDAPEFAFRPPPRPNSAVPLHGFDETAHRPDGTTVEAFPMVVEIDSVGQPRVRLFSRSGWPGSQIAPCESRLHVRDVRRATLPPPLPPKWIETVTRDALVESLDAHGQVVCSRIYRVVIDRAVEIAPVNGKGTWYTKRNRPFYFGAAIPTAETASIRVSAWRGVRPTTFAVKDLEKGMASAPPKQHDQKQSPPN